jgi:hypothetical protein
VLLMNSVTPMINRWTILGSLGVAGALLVITLISIGWTTPRVSPEVGFAPADLTIIAAPTGTFIVTAAPTVDPALITPTPAGDQIAVDAYVQINGTEGEGLRVHATPGWRRIPSSAARKPRYSSCAKDRRTPMDTPGGISKPPTMKPAGVGLPRIFLSSFPPPDLFTESAVQK